MEEREYQPGDQVQSTEKSRAVRSHFPVGHQGVIISREPSLDHVHGQPAYIVELNIELVGETIVFWHDELDIAHDVKIDLRSE